MRALLRMLVAAWALVAARRRRRLEQAGAERAAATDVPDLLERERSATPAAVRGRAELVVAALFGGSAVAGAAFVVVYVVSRDTQLLGAALAVGLGCVSAALIVAAKRVVVQEQAVEHRPQYGDDEAARMTAAALAEGVEGVSRRRLLAGAAGAAAAGLGAAVAVPAASLGPSVDGRIDRTPWHRGVRLVDEQGRGLTADDVELGTFVTAFPQGADRRELGSPVVVLRLDPAELKLPAGRAGWAPEGLVAYSKVCTHAGCAIALYRKPLFPAQSPRPALICPCHYSTFDPARGADVIFGPAGRALAQLPLMLGPARELLAAGGFSGSVGPSWWSVRR